MGHVAAVVMVGHMEESLCLASKVHINDLLSS